MRCPICNHETEENKELCQTCGSRLQQEEIIFAPPVPKSVPDHVSVEKEIPWRKIVPWATGLMCLLLLWLCVLRFVTPVSTTQSTGSTHDTSPPKPTQPLYPQVGSHIPYSHHISISNEHGELRIYRDQTMVLCAESNSSYLNIQHSFSGDQAAICQRTGSSNFYFVQGENCQKLDIGVRRFVLSSSGRAVLYLCDSEHPDFYSLRYHCDGQTEILEAMLDLKSLAGMEISPDGKTIAYLLKSGNSQTLVCRFFQEGEQKTIRIPFPEADLAVISNDAQYIYGAARNGDVQSLYCYDLQGNRTFLENYSLGTKLHFNADNTQLLFYNGDKTYLSTDGQRAQLISTTRILPLLPAYSASIDTDTVFTYSTQHIQYPFDSFYGHAYARMDIRQQNIWYLPEGKELQLVASDTEKCLLDPRGEFLYYFSGSGLYCQHISQGEDKRMLIALDVESSQVEIDVTGDHFYFMKDGGLYTYNRDTNEDPSLVTELRAYTQYPEGSRPWNKNWTDGNIFQVDPKGNICYLSNARLLVIVPGHDPYQHNISYVDRLESTPNGEVIAVCSSNTGQLSYYFVCVNGPDDVELNQLDADIIIYTSK